MEAPPLPDPLQSLVEQRWEAFAEAAEQAGAAVRLTPETHAGLSRVWAVSNFVAHACVQHPRQALELLGSGDLERGYGPAGHATRLARALEGVTDEAALSTTLRRFRRREMVRIIWRDLLARAPLEETTGDLSHLADAVLDQTLSRLHAWLSADLGVPTGAGGEPHSMAVIAMGKLGAGELNLSSDIDLIFAIPDGGTTRGGRRELSGPEYFTRLAQRLIKALNERTPEGFVFRVDMRLRPFGSSGPLVAGYGAIIDYYQRHGRDWERYALIKARAAAGDVALGRQLLEELRPFVYRRYLDYGAFQSLREMKEKVSREVARKGMEEDIKLGPGGIREVEFLAQSFQLIRGGREERLRDRRLLPVLDYLGSRGHLPVPAAARLRDAYRFLRRLEHCLQAVDDRQTQALPAGDSERARVAFGMGHPGWTSLRDTLDHHRQAVHAEFLAVLAPAGMVDEPRRADLAGVWQGSVGRDEALETLRQTGLSDPDTVLSRLERLKETYNVRLMSAEGRERLDRLIPRLLATLAEENEAQETLRRLGLLIEAIARRSVYLALLTEHPDALRQLVRLCAASPWIADHITRFPALLDELLDPRTLYDPPGRPALEAELAGQLAGISGEEEELDTLRLFKQANVLRVAAADISGALPLMRVSDRLTDIAETVLGQTLRLAWRDTTARYGRPRYILEGEGHTAGLAVIAYGKLGGIELGYGSDLDLVFLHDSQGQGQRTDGDRVVENEVFFARLGKRIVHLLTTTTRAGTLYELDFRLRPSGASGMLVTGIETFERYQAERAWTWEHQALVRARPVAGHETLRRRFEAVRRAILARPRDPEALREAVREMRERMRAELGLQDRERFHIKQDRGGVADIEFLVQYGVLRHAARHPALLDYPDNVRLLEGLAAAGLLSQAEAQGLMDAYRTYRARLHRLALAEQEPVLPATELVAERETVTRTWRRWIEAPH